MWNNISSIENSMWDKIFFEMIPKCTDMWYHLRLKKNVYKKNLDMFNPSGGKRTKSIWRTMFSGDLWEM